MGTITPEQILSAISVILILLAAIITIDKAIDIVKKWRASGTEAMKRLDDDQRELTKHARSIKELQSCNHVLCSGILALLDHELHNGNSDQMQAARDDIMNFLQNKI